MKTSKIREIIRQILIAELSNFVISKNIGVSPHTVNRFRGIVASNALTCPKMDSMSDSELRAIFYKKRKSRYKKLKPDWALIYRLMQKKHQTLQQIWEEYRLQGTNDHLPGEDILPGAKDPFYGYSQFVHHFNKFKKSVDISMRQIHRAGETGQVDFAGTMIPITDPSTGQDWLSQVFVGVLPASNYTFAMACRSQSVESWIDAHQKMFGFWGGIPRAIICDNLKAAVIKPGIFPEINRGYLDLSRHYGFVIHPARVRHAQDKGKVENGVKFVSRWLIATLRRRKFFSLEEVNTAIAELLPLLNDRKLKKLPGTRYSAFLEIDKPALQSLPTEPFVFAHWVAEQKVPSDYHIWVLDHSYSVPFNLVSKLVEARYTTGTVEIFHDNKRVAAHVRSYESGSHTTDSSHMPAHHRLYAEYSLEHFLQWSSRVGPCADQVIKYQFDGKSEYSFRSVKACHQLQQLEKMYGAFRFESACDRALLINSPTVKSIRSLLQKNLEGLNRHDSVLQEQLLLHANIRGSEYYTDGGAERC